MERKSRDRVGGGTCTRSFLSKHRDILNRWSLTFQGRNSLTSMHDRRSSCWRDSSLCREEKLFGDDLIANSAFTRSDRFTFRFVVEPWTGISFSRVQQYQYQFTLRPPRLLPSLLPRKYPLSLYPIVSKPTQRSHSSRTRN